MALHYPAQSGMLTILKSQGRRCLAAVQQQLGAFCELKEGKVREKMDYLRKITIAVSTILSISAVRVYRSHMPLVAKGSCVIVDLSTSSRDFADNRTVLVRGRVMENDIESGEMTILVIFAGAFELPVVVTYEAARQFGYINVDCQRP